MRRPSSTVGVTNVVVAHRIGASAVSLSARPARIARVSGCRWSRSLACSGGVGWSGVTGWSGMAFLHIGEEGGDGGPDLGALGEEPVVAVGAVDDDVLAGRALRGEVVAEPLLQARR